MREEGKKSTGRITRAMINKYDERKILKYRNYEDTSNHVHQIETDHREMQLRFHHKNYGVVSPLGNKWTEHFYVAMKEGLYANE